MKIANVTNLIPNDPSIIYCGREHGGWLKSPLGNPFRIGKEGTRKEVIEQYRLWLWNELQNETPEIIEAVNTLNDDSILGCWCYPLACHCEVIQRAKVWLENKKQGIVTDLEEGIGF